MHVYEEPPPVDRAAAAVADVTGVATDIVVRRATHADRPALTRFLETAYGERARYKRARWLWQFIDNPFVHPQGDALPIWLATDGDRIIGQIAVQMGEFQVQGTTVEVGWAADVIILREYRGVGLGHRMNAAVASEVDILMALTMAPASRRLAERLGTITTAPVLQLTRWTRLEADAVRRYLLLRTARRRWPHLAARLACGLQLHRIFAAGVNPLLRLRDLSQRSSAAPETCEIVEVERFGDEIDELWQRTRGEYPLIFPRDSRFLNWRFIDCPQVHYRCFVARCDGRAIGYVVLRRADPVELPQGIIADLYASRRDPETLDALVRHGLAVFGREVSAVDCGTSIAELDIVLRRHGFFTTRSHHPTCICRDSVLRDRLTGLRDDWFFAKADHDWDQVHPADPSSVSE